MAVRLSRFLLSGGGMFLISMAILYVLYNGIGLPYYVGTLVGALVSVTGHYAFARWWIFPASHQTLVGGYERFAAIALVAILCITVGTVLLVQSLGMNVYLARALVSLVAVLGSFFVNGRFNFHAF